MPYTPGTMNERLAGNVFETDEGNSHIRVNQEVMRATGFGDALVRICPANVYSKNADGTISAEFAGCLECGTCLAVAPEGALEWHYPHGAMGVMYREG